jgi:uncharacterized membrane protein
MRPRWLAIGLIASLVLNLFLIGAGVGVVTLGRMMARQNAAAGGGVLVRATRDLPQPDRRNMRLALRKAWLEIKPDAERSSALRLEAWRAIADPKADAAQIKAKLTECRQIDIANRAKAEEEMVDYALTLPPADRRIFAAGMVRVLTPPAGAPKPAAAQPTAPTNTAAVPAAR